MILDCKLKGEYRLQAVRPDGTVRDDSGWFRNLITNYGLDAIITGGGSTPVMTYCSVGTGTTAPAVTQTALVSYLRQKQATTNNPSATVDSADNYCVKQTYTWTFDPAPVNETYSEIGIGGASSGTSLFSRALIVDGGGSPTTFTILAGEQLVVQYRLWLYPQVTDTVQSGFTISGTSYTVTTRGMEVDAPFNPTASLIYGFSSSWANTFRVYNGTIGAATGSPSYTNFEDSGAATPATYTNGTYYRDFTVTWTVSQGNLPSPYITALSFRCFSSIAQMQVGFSPALAKNNTKTLSLTFRLSLTRL